MPHKLTVGNIARRLVAPTPPFWKKVRNVMITTGLVGGAILAAPIALPAVITTIAGYLIAVGSVGTVLAQATEQK